MDFSTLLELVGVAVMVVAAWFVSPVVGMVALGLALVVIGYLLERD
jgi:hypothetical protein